MGREQVRVLDTSQLPGKTFAEWQVVSSDVLNCNASKPAWSDGITSTNCRIGYRVMELLSLDWCPK